MIEYFTQHLWLFWTIIAMSCLIIELGSGDFFITSFAIGAVCSVFASFIGVPFWLQAVVFALFSVLSILFIRPSLLKRLHAAGREQPSNADALIGRIGTVIEPITAGGSGYVKIDGDEWRAVSAETTAIETGEKVKVVSLESIVVTVVRA